MKTFFALVLSCLIFLGTASTFPTYAAYFQAGEEVTLSGATPLEDAYLFGGNIKVDAPVTNDVVAAGGDIEINQNVTGSIMAAGGNINLRGITGNTVRVAGGNIRIDGPITRDLVITGGSITITNNATIGKDLIFNGGKLVLEGPVKGNVVVNGGEATINSTIDGNVNGTIEELTLGPNAKIAGNLSYKSENPASIANGATVQGQTNHTPIERSEQKNDGAAFITAGAIYKLIADIIISILLIYFFGKALLPVLNRMREKPVEGGAIGFAFVLLFPIVALILFILIWLGVAAWIMYGFILLISLYLVKIFLGWLALYWWEKRNKREYILDWRAGIVGPLLLFILLFIPIVGWLTGAVIFCIATGSLIYLLTQLAKEQKLLPQKAAAKKK